MQAARGRAIGRRWPRAPELGMNMIGITACQRTEPQALACANFPDSGTFHESEGSRRLKPAARVGFAEGDRVLRWLLCLLAVAVVTGTMTARAAAEDRFYVLRDGSKVPLTKSDSELALVFRSFDDIAEATQRLESAAVGDVVGIEGAPGARVRILRLPQAVGGDVVTGKIEEDPAVEEVQPVYRFAGSASPVVPTGQIVLKLRAGLSTEQREAFWQEFGITGVQAFEGLHDVYIGTPSPGADDIVVAENMAADGRTLWANPDLRMVYRPAQVVGADTYADLQWHLHNTGQTGGTNDADIDAPEAWSIATGTGILFGMFDDGCDVDHEDLSANYIGVGQDIARFPFDDPRPKTPSDAHGTAVMGLAVASANAVGVRGVAFRAQFTASRGLGDFISNSGLASTYAFAMQQGVDVHINSWGPIIPNVIETPPVVADAIETAFREGRDPDGDGPEPPLGMVIVFGSGNDGVGILPGFGPATLPEVISVGASDGDDKRAGFSSFGTTLNFLAPGGSGGSLGIVTTDNEDGKPSGADGYNEGGVLVEPGTEETFGGDIDPSGKYTGFFGGTSAACPIAAGVAGLVLSVNPDLTATDVRILMEHSCDQISPDDAQYDGITSKSLTYGYGRINAHKAVTAARLSVDNGGFTWPDVPGDARLDGRTLRWTAGVGTEEFLVIESSNFVTFAPLDGACYHASQNDCENATLTPLPEGVQVVSVGCKSGCEPGSDQSVDVTLPVAGTKLFGIYGRSEIGRYSFGAAARANSVRAPAVTISASPLAGPSPLTVRFNGNATGEQGIDPTRGMWEFFAPGDTAPMSQQACTSSGGCSATVTFRADPGQTSAFRARLTMYDVLGIEGSAEVQILVAGPALPIDSTSTTTAAGTIRIVVSIPGTSGSDVSQITSGSQVELKVDANAPGNARSVTWYFGDGSASATGTSVVHVYTNTGSTSLVLPVTAKVTSLTAAGTTTTVSVTRLLTVLPGTGQQNPGEPDLPGTHPIGGGGSANPCGALGMVPILFGFTGLWWLRRRRT